MWRERSEPRRQRRNEEKNTELAQSAKAGDVEFN